LKPLLTGRYAGFLCRLSDGLNGIRHILGAGALARLFAGDFLVFVVAAELLAISVFPLVKERLKRRSLFFIAGYAWQISLYVYSLIITNNQLPRWIDRKIFDIGCARLISGHLRADCLRSKSLELIINISFPGENHAVRIY